MSNVPGHPSPEGVEPTSRALLLSALAWVGVILIFVLIVVIAYIPTRAPSPSARDIDDRMRIRSEVRGEQARLMQHYAWEDREGGIVRLAIDDHLLRLTLEELREANEAKLAANGD